MHLRIRRDLNPQMLYYPSEDQRELSRNFLILCRLLSYGPIQKLDLMYSVHIPVDSHFFLSTWKIKQEMGKNRALHFCERGWLKRPLEGPKPPWLVEMSLSIYL